MGQVVKVGTRMYDGSTAYVEIEYSFSLTELEACKHALRDFEHDPDVEYGLRRQNVDEQEDWLLRSNTLSAQGVGPKTLFQLMVLTPRQPGDSG
jgi:hypothetical protein